MNILGRGTNQASASSYPASNATIEKEEPEKIRKWRENKKKMIAEKGFFLFYIKKI